MGLLGRKSKVVGMREDAYKFTEGFISVDDLVAKGYTQTEIDVIEKAGAAGVALASTILFIFGSLVPAKLAKALL